MIIYQHLFTLYSILDSTSVPISEYSFWTFGWVECCNKQLQAPGENSASCYDNTVFVLNHHEVEQLEYQMGSSRAQQETLTITPTGLEFCFGGGNLKEIDFLFLTCFSTLPAADMWSRCISSWIYSFFSCITLLEVLTNPVVKRCRFNKLHW